MPNSPEHDASYRENRAVLTAGFVASNPRWAAIVAFYAAVHLIERLAAAEQPRPVHHRSHKNRNKWLNRPGPHRAILSHYIVLQDASESARYGTLNQFQNRFAARVQSHLIDIHLVAIERYVAAFFAPPLPPPAPAAAAGS